eukprot:8267805-Pyramimonas_sp.AAC.1
MCTQPTRASKHQEIKLKTLGDVKLKWKNLQSAVEKEWNTWCRHDAATHISGAAVGKIDPDKILSSKVVWVDKDPTTFEPKAGICRRGYEEEFDDKLRRDSPTVSAQMALLLCSIVSSLNLDLIVAD